MVEIGRAVIKHRRRPSDDLDEPTTIRQNSIETSVSPSFSKICVYNALMRLLGQREQDYLRFLLPFSRQHGPERSQQTNFARTVIAVLSLVSTPMSGQFFGGQSLGE